MKILSVPQAVENVLNIFFSQDNNIKDSYQTFGLWCIEVVFELMEIRVSKPVKIYDIKKSLRRNIRI